MHVVNKPYLLRMGEVIPNRRWEKRAVGFDNNFPDGRVTKRLSLIVKQGKPPAAKKWIFSMFVEYSRLNFLGDLVMGFYRGS